MSDQGRDDCWYPNIVERLFREFEDRHSLPAILAVVKGCRWQLDASPPQRRPELIERLARQRLTRTP